MDKLKSYKILLLLIVLLYGLYNLPFFKALISYGINLPDLFSGNDKIITPLSRSLFFGLSQALIYCLFSLFFASFLFKIKITNWKSRFLTLLILPFLIGNVSVAFIFKLILTSNDFIFSSENKILMLSVMCLWQYGTLFTYLFWLNQQTISPEKVLFYKTSNLTHFEIFKDIILPKQKNLLILTFIVGFVFSIYEDFKFKLLFKASRGTDTELINSWINRKYTSDTLSNTSLAFENLSQYSALTIIASLVTLLILSFVLLSVLKRTSKSKLIFNLNFKQGKFHSIVALVILLSFVLLPFLIVLPKFFSFSMVNLLELSGTVGLTAMVAIISTTIAVVLGYFLRINWSPIFHSLNRKSVGIIALNFILILSPPILLLILGFQWMKWLGYSTLFNVYLAWSYSQILYVMPILTAFVIVTHFRVRQNDLEYLLIHNVDFSNVAKSLFWLPLKGEYLLLLIFAFSSVWNESSINIVLSDTIPSFATELSKTIIGRSVDYSSGITYLLFSIFIGFTCITIWDRLLVSYYKNTAI